MLVAMQFFALRLQAAGGLIPRCGNIRYVAAMIQPAGADEGKRVWAKLLCEAKQEGAHFTTRIPSFDLRVLAFCAMAAFLLQHCSTGAVVRGNAGTCADIDAMRNRRARDAWGQFASLRNELGRK